MDRSSSVAFEYTTLYTYLHPSSEKNREQGIWVIAYQGVEFDKFSYLDAILCKMGLDGWELVSVSTVNESNIKESLGSALFLGIGASGISFTGLEAFYFKRKCTEGYLQSEKVSQDINFINDMVENRRNELIKLQLEKEAKLAAQPKSEKEWKEQREKIKKRMQKYKITYSSLRSAYLYKKQEFSSVEDAIAYAEKTEAE